MFLVSLWYFHGLCPPIALRLLQRHYRFRIRRSVHDAMGLRAQRSLLVQALARTSLDPIAQCHM